MGSCRIWNEAEESSGRALLWYTEPTKGTSDWRPNWKTRNLISVKYEAELIKLRKIERS